MPVPVLTFDVPNNIWFLLYVDTDNPWIIINIHVHGEDPISSLSIKIKIFLREEKRKK